MAKQIIARQCGDEYQQLVFWKYALRMISEKDEIKSVGYEDDTIKSYDDIVIQYSKPKNYRNSEIIKEFIQVKFHMRDNGLFSIENLIDPSFINSKKNSLLSNIVEGYRKLGQKEFEKSMFVIYSMWDIKQDDVLYKIVSNLDSTIIIEKLFDNTTQHSEMGKVRNKLCNALGIGEKELEIILKQVKIKNRKEKMDDLIENLNQELDKMGLQLIDTYNNPYSQLIQKLFVSGYTEYTKLFLEKQLKKAKLYSNMQPADENNSFFNFVQNGDNNTQIGYIANQTIVKK